MNRENYEPILNIRKMKRIIEKGNEDEKNAISKRRSISFDNDHSKDWKDRKISDVNKEEQSLIRENGAKISELSTYFKNYLNDAKHQFDYTDSNLQFGLQLIRDRGMSLPIEVRNSIIEKFRGNPTALELIKITCERNNINTSSIDEARRLFTEHREMEATLKEMIGRATCPAEVANAQWQPQNLTRLMKDFEKTFGVDTSVNPYLAEIEHFKTKELTTIQSRRLEGFIDGYANDLDNDDVTAINKAKDCLANEFLKSFS